MFTVSVNCRFFENFNYIRVMNCLVAYDCTQFYEKKNPCISNELKFLSLGLMLSMC